MADPLRKCIDISKQILALTASLSSPPRTLVPQAEVDAVSAIAARGLPSITHASLPSTLATKLHLVAQKSFYDACMALLHQHRPAGMTPRPVLAAEMQRTFIAQYKRKVSMALTAMKRAARLTPQQKQPYANDILMYAYEQSQTPSKRERHQLSLLTGLTLEQVRVWFQNRRQRMKKRAPELQSRSALSLEDLLARVAAVANPADRDDDFDDNDSGYCSASDRASSAVPFDSHSGSPAAITFPSTTTRSYPAPYVHRELTTEFTCAAPTFRRTAALHAPVHVESTTISELAHLMSRLTLRHRRQTPRSSTTGAASVLPMGKPAAKNRKVGSSNPVPTNSDAATRKKAVRKDPETGRKVAGRRMASAGSAASSAASSSPSSASSSPDPAISSNMTDASAKSRKRAGPLRRKPVGNALSRQASGSSVVSTSSSDSSRSTSYSSDFSLASDSSFTSVESVPTAASMDCFQPQQQPQFDPLAAFDFTQLFSSQPSDILPQPVADFELPPDLLAGLQMPMDTAALSPPESTDFLALLNDPTIQDLLQSVQDMDVVAPQQMQESLTFNNAFDVGSVDTSAFLDLSASTLPTFDAMFGLDATSFQDTLWNSPGFSLPITA